MSNQKNIKRFIPEWERQDGVLIAWPHEHTDWNYMLDEVTECYVSVAKAISATEHLIIVAPDIAQVKSDLSKIDCSNISFYQVQTNDTWARDFGGITISVDSKPVICDFKFNAWGGKFDWLLDNRVNNNLSGQGAFKCELQDCKDFVLEGGSIETDGKGTLLTTSKCLLTSTRNSELNKSQIEQELKGRLGVKKVLWLDYGFLSGDDTDSHIDTLARLTPDGGILYVACDDKDDCHYGELQKMQRQIRTFSDAEGNPLKCYPLPFPKAIYDENEERLPATYANYLVINGKVLVPTYNQPETDKEALDVISKAFPGYDVEGIDCRSLIRQHGSLHCITMQFAENTLEI